MLWRWTSTLYLLCRRFIGTTQTLQPMSGETRMGFEEFESITQTDEVVVAPSEPEPEVKELVIAFYTIGTAYERWVPRFKEKCEELGLPYDVRGYRDHGSWIANCGLKPGFIQAMQKEYPQHRLLYLDIDCTILHKPKIFTEGDIAVYRKDSGYLLSGTMVFMPTQAARDIVEEWRVAQSLRPKRADEQTLRDIVDAHENDPQSKVRIAALPRTYLEWYQIKPESVIAHYNSLNWLSTLKVRQNGDTFYILAPNRKAQQHLDRTMVRIGKLKWRARTDADISFYDLLPVTDKQTLAIVKRPPSTPLNKNAIALCLNAASYEAIHETQAIAFQNDDYLGRQFEKFTKLIITPACKKFYPEPCYRIHPENYEYAFGTLALCGILAKELQVAKIETYGLTDHDLFFLKQGLPERLVNTFSPWVPPVEVKE